MISIDAQQRRLTAFRDFASGLTVSDIAVALGIERSSVTHALRISARDVGAPVRESSTKKGNPLIEISVLSDWIEGNRGKVDAYLIATAATISARKEELKNNPTKAQRVNRDTERKMLIAEILSAGKWLTSGEIFERMGTDAPTTVNVVGNLLRGMRKDGEITVCADGGVNSYRIGPKEEPEVAADGHPWLTQLGIIYEDVNDAQGTPVFCPLNGSHMVRGLGSSLADI